jgi:hypothetical protein
MYHRGSFDITDGSETKPAVMAEEDIKAYLQDMGLEPVNSTDPGPLDKDEEIRQLREQLSAAKRALGGWQLFARQILNCILLTPAMNDFYSTLLKELLKDVCLGVPQVQGYFAFRRVDIIINVNFAVRVGRPSAVRRMFLPVSKSRSRPPSARSAELGIALGR